jgi:Cu/Ag efflux protein CusF
MKTLIVAAVVSAFAAFAWYLLPSPPRADAERIPGGHANHAGDPNALADGVVLSVDRIAKSVTIRHGRLQNLGMPSMTMAFQVGDPAMLERVKPGDKVKFHVDAIGGAFTVMSIEIAI